MAWGNGRDLRAARAAVQVHARDVIEKLAKANCTSCNDFEWVSQLRFYWDKELNDCVVKQVTGRFQWPSLRHLLAC